VGLVVASSPTGAGPSPGDRVGLIGQAGREETGRLTPEQRVILAERAYSLACASSSRTSPGRRALATRSDPNLANDVVQAAAQRILAGEDAQKVADELTLLGAEMFGQSLATRRTSSTGFWRPQVAEPGPRPRHVWQGGGRRLAPRQQAEFAEQALASRSWRRREGRTRQHGDRRTAAERRGWQQGAASLLKGIRDFFSLTPSSRAERDMADVWIA